MSQLYYFARSVYWKMPQHVQKALRIPARRVAKALRNTSIPEAGLRGLNAFNDLTWEQFENNILAHSSNYKGIFIQGPVIDWDIDLFQRPQHMAAAFARRGYLVIYHTHCWANDDVSGFRQVLPNVWLTNYDVITRTPEAVVSIYSTAYANADTIIATPKDKIHLVYEYIDHIDPKISGDAENIDRLIRLKDFAFSGGADMIVASSMALYTEAVAAVGEEKVVLAQNGVDTTHYRNHQSDTVTIPDNFTSFRRKYKNIVGYFGALAPWIWYEEINKLIKNRPDLGFIFIGPDYYGGSKNIVSAENVLCTGPIDYKDLPAYAKQFDICFIPFEPGEIAKTTSPLKLFEYFALEKPVVVTSTMEECTIYPEVFSGNGADQLSSQIDRALEVKDDARFKARLASLADENDWDHRAAAYEKVYEGLRIAK
ncbi:glycosyltransferase family 1 protein [Paraburkholderia aspalathi]|nr:glycosyltransferase family 1 protein [Paraburkholderia aspalathi]